MKLSSLLTIILLFYFLGETSCYWIRRRRRTFPPPCYKVNCHVSSWTSWSSCSHQCGASGIQTRRRYVVRWQACGGYCPYNLRQTQWCNRGNCRNGGTPWSGGCSCRTGYGGTCCERGKYCRQLPHQIYLPCLIFTPKNKNLQGLNVFYTSRYTNFISVFQQ